MANTVRVFLGTRLECAQCHDHPFDEWTQRQFYEMAAYTGGLRYTHDELDGERRRLRKLGRELREQHGVNAPRALRRLLQPAGMGIAGSGDGAVRLPDDYQYDDASPDELVHARVLFGEDPELEARRATRRPSARPPPRWRPRGARRGGGCQLARRLRRVDDFAGQPRASPW